MTRIVSSSIGSRSIGFEKPSRNASSQDPSSRALASQATARLADYVELTKPRIVALELVTVAVAAVVASPRSMNPWVLFHALLGAGLVAASAGAFNQWLERDSDALMPRTADRPLPTGRLAAWEVLTIGAVMLVLGSVELVWFVNPTSALFGLATWFVYLAIYTPLKSRSPANTAVGAVSGALPILLGWSATGAAIDSRAIAMAGVLFLWQFPHFMANAWLYREEYKAAGQKMLTVVDPSGIRAGGQAVIAALALIPVSLVPALAPHSASPSIYLAWTLLLGTVQCLIAITFLFRRDDKSARRLLYASLLYLPCWLGLLVMVSV